MEMYTAPVTRAVLGDRKTLTDEQWREYLRERCKLRSRSYFYYLAIQVEQIKSKTQ